MKPNFALSLSFDGIALLHRSGRAGWYLVGEVPLDADDLAGDLAELRSKAVALEPSGLATKLIIPDDQIRYMDVPAPGDAAHDRAAREALEGATPYHVDDLSYDWSLSDGRLYIAAVASETLDEAESFAVEHRFNPVSFVARPETDAFVGEPFFGLAAQARDVERDTVPVEILGRAHMPEPPDPAVVVAMPSGDRDADTDPVAPAATAKPEPDPAPAPDPTPEETVPVPTFASRRVNQVDPAVIARPVASEETGGASGAPDPGSVDPETVDVAAPRALPALSTMAAASLEPLAADKTAGAPEDVSAPAIRPRCDPPGAAPAVSVGSAARAATEMSPEAEAQRLTIFGARRETPVGGKPRFLGLILTAMLLLFLIGVAAFATIFADDGFSKLFRGSGTKVAETPMLDPLPDSEPTETVVQRPETTTQPEVAAPTRAEADGSRAGPEIRSEEAAETPAEGAEGTFSTDETASREPVDATPPVTPAEPPQRIEERRLSRYAATGIWHMPPDPPAVPDAGGLDDVYQTSIDMAVDVRDAVALPTQPEVRSDRRPPTPPDPVSAGTTFSLDQRGLVAATPQGALTPEGVPVRSGPPPARPPEVPPRAVPLADQSLDAETAAEVMRLGGIRPRSRPTDLIEQQERGALSGRSRSELASLRPRPRPQQLDRATAEADPETRAASLAGPLLRVPSEAEPEDEVDALPQAVASSAKPRQRPTAVERAAEQTAAAPVQTATAPRIPSRASVARQATERNAINLRNVNLIGVYGTRQERRALVRLSNGRYQKVKVGDTLDGGRVSAIGDSELRYNKRGRNVVLRLPKG